MNMGFDTTRMIFARNDFSIFFFSIIELCNKYDQPREQASQTFSSNFINSLDVNFACVI